MSSKRQRALNIVLVVSLAINVLVFGGMAARYFDGPSGRPIPPNLFWILRELDEDTKTRLRPVLEEYSSEIRPMRAALVQAQRTVNELLTEESLDPELLATAFANLRSAGMQYQHLSHQQTISLFARLRPEQRIDAMRYIKERSRPARAESRDRASRRVEEQAH